MKDKYTTKEVVQLLETMGIADNVQRVRYLSEKGRIKSQRIGRDLIFEGHSLCEYIFDELYKKTESKDRLAVATPEGREKIVWSINLSLCLLKRLRDFKESFALSFNMSDQYIFQHISQIVHLPIEKREFGIIAFHKEIDAEDSKNSDLAIQIREAGRVPNLTMIARLNDFTKEQMSLIEELVEIVSLSINKWLPLDGNWIDKDESGDWEINPERMINSLVTAHYFIVNDPKEIACVKAYRKAAEGIEKFLKELDKNGAQRPPAIAGLYPLDQLFFVRPLETDLTLKYQPFINLIRTGLVGSITDSKSTSLSEQYYDTKSPALVKGTTNGIDPSNIKAIPPQKLETSGSFKILNAPSN